MNKYRIHSNYPNGQKIRLFGIRPSLVDSLFPVPARIDCCTRSQKFIISLLSIFHYLSVSITCLIATLTLVPFSTRPIHTRHEPLPFLRDAGK